MYHPVACFFSLGDLFIDIYLLMLNKINFQFFIVITITSTHTLAHVCIGYVLRSGEAGS